MIPPISFEKRILVDLFTDFQTKDIKHEGLKKGYEGLSISELKSKFAPDGSSDEVYFDMAFSELEKNKLIWTGPREFFNNKVNGISHIGTENKRIYVCITEEGIKFYFNKFQATPAGHDSPSKMVQNIIKDNLFYQSPLAVGENITQSVALGESRDALLKGLLDILREEKGQLTNEDTEAVEVLVESVESGENIPKIKERFQKVFGFAKQGVKEVAWGLIADVLSSQLHL